ARPFRTTCADKEPGGRGGIESHAPPAASAPRSSVRAESRSGGCARCPAFAKPAPVRVPLSGGGSGAPHENDGSEEPEDRGGSLSCAARRPLEAATERRAG